MKEFVCCIISED